MVFIHRSHGHISHVRGSKLTCGRLNEVHNVCIKYKHGDLWFSKIGFYID